MSYYSRMQPSAVVLVHEALEAAFLQEPLPLALKSIHDPCKRPFHRRWLWELLPGRRPGR